MIIPFHRPVVPKKMNSIFSESVYNGWLTTGPQVKEFESILKNYLCADHVIAVNSCTAALHLSLLAIKLKKNDLMGEVGFGLDCYLQYFKFSPQIKLSYGILNLLSKDETIYTKSINRLSTNGWMLSFTFE